MESYGASVSGSPAIIAMTGPPIAVDTLPGIVMNNVALTALLAVALVAMLTVVRHTRGEEEEGRSEVLRATVVGRHAGSAAALLLVTALSVVLGLGCGARGARFAGAGVRLVAVRRERDRAGDGVRRRRAGRGPGLHARPRGLRDLVGRPRGRVRHPGGRRRPASSWLVWLSPIGWSQATHPLGTDERWWPLLVSLLAVGVLAGVAVALANRRDVGAGLVPDRGGSATASTLAVGPGGAGASGCSVAR